MFTWLRRYSRASPLRVTIDRLLGAPRSEVWEFITDPAKLERWMAPRGCVLEIHEYELRVGGCFAFTRTMVRPDLVAIASDSGLPLSSSSRRIFRRIEPPSVLAYTSPLKNPADATVHFSVIELEQQGEETLLRLTMDALDSEMGTKTLLLWASEELDDLARVIAAQSTP